MDLQGRWPNRRSVYIGRGLLSFCHSACVTAAEGHGVPRGDEPGLRLSHLRLVLFLQYDDSVIAVKVKEREVWDQTSLASATDSISTPLMCHRDEIIIIWEEGANQLKKPLAAETGESLWWTVAAAALPTQYQGNEGRREWLSLFSCSSFCSYVLRGAADTSCFFYDAHRHRCEVQHVPGARWSKRRDAEIVSKCPFSSELTIPREEVHWKHGWGADDGCWVLCWALPFCPHCTEPRSGCPAIAAPGAPTAARGSRGMWSGGQLVLREKQ